MSVQNNNKEEVVEEDKYWLTCELYEVQSCGHWSYEHCDCDCHFNIKEKAREQERQKGYEKGFIDGSELTGRIAGETHAIELSEEREKGRDEVIMIIKNSRTIDETFGVGKKEEQARSQAVADILLNNPNKQP